jgi:hypothetical protein
MTHAGVASCCSHAIASLEGGEPSGCVALRNVRDSKSEPEFASPITNMPLCPLQDPSASKFKFDAPVLHWQNDITSTDTVLVPITSEDPSVLKFKIDTVGR